MNNNFLKECLKFNKDNINYAYSTLEKYQEHGEKITENFLKLPINKEFETQGREMLNSWKSFVKEGQDNMKKIIEDSFNNFEKVIG